MYSEAVEVGVTTETAPTLRVAAPVFPRRSLAFIVTAGFLLRLLYMLVNSTYTPFDKIWGLETKMIAVSIASGHGYSSPFGGNTGPTAWVTPVFPYLAAAVFRLLGMRLIASIFVVFSINALFSALTCIPIFLIGTRLGSRRIGLCAALLWAVLPGFMVFAMTWFWETALSTLLLSLILLLTMRLEDARGLLPWLGFGLLWGLAALTNPALTAFLPLSGCWAAWQARRRGKRVLTPVAVSALACVVTITPWLVRNYEVFGRFVFLRSNFGAELRYGNTAYGRGLWNCCEQPSVTPRAFQHYARRGELAYVQDEQKDAFDFIRRYPALFANLTLRRMVYFWNGVPDVSSENLQPHDMIATWPYLALSATGLLGLLVLLRQRKRAAGLLAGLYLSYPVTYYITFPTARYRHPIEPMLLIGTIVLFAETRELRRYFYS